MAYGKPLLARVRESDGTFSRAGEATESEVIEAVLRHLQQMLNTRQGSSTAVPEYGSPDYNDLLLQFPAAIPEIRKQLKAAIDRFEPRLSRAQVRHVPDADRPLTLRFDIAGHLLVGDEEIKIGFETLLDDTGHIRVRR